MTRTSRRVDVLYSAAVAVFVPTTLDEAFDVLVAHPGATPLAGGTDLVVELNEGHRRFAWEAADVLALAQVPELTTWSIDPEARTLTLGAGVTWSAIERDPLRSLVPALAEAARTVGSPQIRNAGTVGGNLATCSPAGDGLPVLAALDATVVLRSAGGERSLPIAEFMVGVKRTALEPGELIVATTVPLLDGWQGYSKVGVRNAMVIAIAGACLATDLPSRSVRVAMGSVAPTIVRAPAAEAFAADAVDWDSMSVATAVAERFGELAAEATSPIDDHRATAAYRRHAVRILASRLLQRAFPRGGRRG